MMRDMHSEGTESGPQGGGQRFYRSWATGRGLCGFQVTIGETDLQLFADRPLEGEAESAIRRVRRDIELYAAGHDGFLETLGAMQPMPGAPEPVRRMCEASACYGVGPMAAVAGVIAEFVGRELLGYSTQVIVENGGDIFFQTEAPPILGLYAGPLSPYTGRVRFRPRRMKSGGICTSSGTVGHSLSFGRADAVVVVARNATLADAAATAIANSVRDAEDVQKAIDLEQERELIDGVLIATGKTLGVWGELEILEGA